MTMQQIAILAQILVQAVVIISLGICLRFQRQQELLKRQSMFNQEQNVAPLNHLEHGQ